MTTDAARVWVVDDDRSVRFVLATALRDAGYQVDGFDGAAAALEALQRRGAPDLLFTDLRMPGEDGLALLERLKAAHPRLPVIVMSAYTDVASAAGAFRGGAHEFLSKPFDLDDAIELAGRCLPSRDAGDGSGIGREAGVGDGADSGGSGGKAGAAEAGVGAAAGPVAARGAVAAGSERASAPKPALIGGTPAMRALFRAIGRLAQAPLSVLITGETGTGKELVANALHRESPRARMPFVALNTAAIPAELLESELFGHEAGAFTGAQRRHVGRFEQADGGTLFLDEIGDMPLSLQTRLLRVLAEGEFFRVGGRELIRVDVRVVAATHQDLYARVAEGGFRADLLHRLDVVRLHLPPLRERRADVPLLAENFLSLAARKLGAPAKRLSPAALEALRAHDWPGNVRELENVCWRLAALAPGDTVTADDLAAALARAPATAGGDSAAQGWEAALAAWAHARLAEGAQGLHAEARAALDRTLLEVALQHTQGHRAHAAALIGVGRNTVTRKLGPGRKRR